MILSPSSTFPRTVCCCGCSSSRRAPHVAWTCSRPSITHPGAALRGSWTRCCAPLPPLRPARPSSPTQSWTRVYVKGNTDGVFPLVAIDCLSSIGLHFFSTHAAHVGVFSRFKHCRPCFRNTPRRTFVGVFPRHSLSPYVCAPQNLWLMKGTHSTPAIYQRNLQVILSLFPVLPSPLRPLPIEFWRGVFRWA